MQACAQSGGAVAPTSSACVRAARRGAADPHDAIRGFWFAHMGWLYLKKDPRVAEAGRKVNVDDLKADWPVMFQHRNDPWWNFVWCFFIPGFVAQLAWGETFWNGFFSWAEIIGSSILISFLEAALGRTVHCPHFILRKAIRSLGS